MYKRFKFRIDIKSILENTLLLVYFCANFFCFLHFSTFLFRIVIIFLLNTHTQHMVFMFQSLFISQNNNIWIKANKNIRFFFFFIYCVFDDVKIGLIEPVRCGLGWYCRKRGFFDFYLKFWWDIECPRWNQWLFVTFREDFWYWMKFGRNVDFVFK